MGVFAILIAIVAVVAYLERAQLKTLLNRTPTTSVTNTHTPTVVLSIFPDWRVAYVAKDGSLHAVSLNGQIDVTGVSLPALSGSNASGTPVTGATLGSEAASPDGRYLAYDGSGSAVLVHLTAHLSDKDAIRSNSVPRGALWSPDSAKLAWLGANGAVHLTASDSLTDSTVAATTGQGIQEILGWVDGTHLAVRVAKTGATSETVAALDITNGQQRAIVTLTKAGYGAYHYRLSPDGAQLLAWNSAINGQPFTAIFRNYDTKAGGTVHKLPNSLKAVGENITAVAWKPKAATVAVASGTNETHDLKLWLVDAAGDSAMSLGAAYPVGWLTDGSQLITSSANAAKLGGGPYTISAISFPATGAPTPVKLTDKAMSFPWLGLVRTG